MLSTATTRLALSSFALAAVVSSSGCELADAFSGKNGTLVQVSTTHHATPEDGLFPSRGGDGEFRVFETDEGWQVTLVEAFVVTRDLQLEDCSGNVIDVELYWGHLAEDIKVTDLDPVTVGGTELSDVSLCGVTVTYGPFDATTTDGPSEDDAMVHGATIYLKGFAERRNKQVPFEIRATDDVRSHLDLLQAGNGPVRIDGNEAFPVELTFSKTYDRFFDGVDFSTFSAEDLEAQVLAVLELETQLRVN
jgi:hypothetical protein